MDRDAPRRLAALPRGSAMSVDPLLPLGIKVGSGLGLDERPVVTVEFELKGGEVFALVLSPQHVRALIIPFLDQDDRRVRTLAALMLRQARLIEEANWRGLRVVGGSEA